MRHSDATTWLREQGETSGGRVRGIPALWSAVASWLERARQRRELLRLDSRVLKDIGVNWADAANEAAKPFWRE
jgi:uncharacterized protein YjiS (DUF1127 family)